MKTAVIIDDDKDFRSVMSQWLTELGWRVLFAEDGEVGLSMVIIERPDLVVCDLLMPGHNGFHVCRAIRAQPDNLAHTRILVTTGSSYDADKSTALEAGADAYLVKPIKPDELTRVIAELSPASPADSASAEPVAPKHWGSEVRLRFWGVRGSIPTPGPGTIFYGGNTSCVEVRADDELIILDAGSGIRPLGHHLAGEFKGQPLHLTLLISHTHWDHIQGFPFFVPAYNPQNRLRILGYDGARRGLDTTLSSQMESPYFPIGMRQMPGNISVHELKELDFSVGSVPVKAAFLNHPGICMGYRLFTSAGSISYVPDNEPFQRLRTLLVRKPGTDAMAAVKFASNEDLKIIEFIKDSDILIIDAQYDDAEYQMHVGWGHGCVDDVVAMAVLARVKQLYLFHHDPDHDDRQISRMVAWARELVATQDTPVMVEAAREGMEIVLRAPASARSAPAAIPELTPA